MHGPAVRFVVLWRDHRWNPLVHYCSCWGHTTRSTEHQRRERCVLNFPHSLVIRPFLLQFISAVALRHGSVPVALRGRVEHPYVKECALPVSSPEVCGHNVQSCTIFPVCWPVCQLLLSHMLQCWLCADAVTYLTQEISGVMAMAYIAMARGSPWVVPSWDRRISPSMKSWTSSR